jgi:hypothetical protein
MKKKKAIKKKKEVWCKVDQKLCCVCKKPAVLVLPHRNEPTLRVGLCDKHYESYNDLTIEERKAFQEKHFNREVKEIEICQRVPTSVECPQKSVVAPSVKPTSG